MSIIHLVYEMAKALKLLLNNLINMHVFQDCLVNIFFTVIFVSNILQYKAYIINLRVNKGHIKPNKIIRE